MKEKILRKVYCLATIDNDTQLYCAYRDPNFFIPKTIYKLNNYKMTNIKTNAVFKRWATGFDL